MTPKGLEGTFVDGAGVEPLCNSLDGAMCRTIWQSTI